MIRHLLFTCSARSRPYTRIFAAVSSIATRQETMAMTESINLFLLLFVVSNIIPTEQVFFGGNGALIFPDRSRRNYTQIPPDPCDRYDVDGCSVPFKDAFQMVRRFTPACNRHDICYDCGKVRSVTRQECDLAFLEDMTKICNGKPVTAGRRKRAAHDKSAPDGDKTSAQIFMSKQPIFLAVAEKVLGENFDTFVAHASKAQMRLSMEDIAPLWEVLLTAFQEEGISDQQALDLVDEYRHSNPQPEVFKRDTDDKIDIPSCLLAARAGFSLVTFVAMFNYQIPSMPFCHEDFVDDCMPQNL